MEKMKTNKGITLIALIITIIILLILATITLEVALDGKLFDTAKKAVNETNAKTAQEQNRVDELTEKLNEIENKNEEDEIPDDPAPGECEHSYGEWITETEATCTATGTKKRTCSLCNYINTQTIDATGHTWSDWVETTAATTTTTGIATSTCTKCGATQTKEIPMLEVDGKITFNIDGTEYIADDGMTWSNWVESAYNTGGYIITTTWGYGYVTTSGATKYLKPQVGGMYQYYIQSTAEILNGGTYISVDYGVGGFYQ